MHYSYEDVETFIPRRKCQIYPAWHSSMSSASKKNISILPQELKRAFSEGISFRR